MWHGKRQCPVPVHGTHSALDGALCTAVLLLLRSGAHHARTAQTVSARAAHKHKQHTTHPPYHWPLVLLDSSY